MKKIFSMNRFEGWNLSLPLIQGGMGVGISLSSLAGAVAKAGGVGIISTAQIGFREPDFKENPLKANLRAIGSELKKSREIAPKGVIGFNIMVATRNYEEYVKTAVKAGADIIISGAGLPVSLPEYVREAEGKAQAIEAVQKATAQGIQYLNEATPTSPVLTLKSLEAFEKAADGKATKIIIPSDIQGIAGLASSLKEIVTDPKAETDK